MTEEDNSPVIAWDRPMLKRLKLAHAKARMAGLEEFEFERHQFVTNYAKHLIEYLDGILAPLK